MAANATDWLNGVWRDMRNDASPLTQSYVNGALDALQMAGSITPEQHELWTLRFRTTCPGHDDEGGRAWCAYCGNMKDEETTT